MNSGTWIVTPFESLAGLVLAVFVAPRMTGEVCTTVMAVSADGKRATLRRRNGATARLEAPSPAELLESVRPEDRVNGGVADA